MRANWMERCREIEEKLKKAEEVHAIIRLATTYVKTKEENIILKQELSKLRGEPNGHETGS